jgi:hypothetical protein
MKILYDRPVQAEDLKVGLRVFDRTNNQMVKVRSLSPRMVVFADDYQQTTTCGRAHIHDAQYYHVEAEKGTVFERYGKVAGMSIVAVLCAIPYSLGLLWACVQLGWREGRESIHQLMESKDEPS